jgi:hypothetical protein
MPHREQNIHFGNKALLVLRDMMEYTISQGCPQIATITQLHDNNV